MLTSVGSRHCELTVIVVVGFVLGSLLCVALIVVGSQFFGPRHIEPQLPGVVATSVAAHFGVGGLLIAIGGMFFAFAGAAIETALSAAYCLAQFFGWPWGRFRPPREAARFTIAWVAVFGLASAVILTGVDPVSVVEYSIVFSVVILPLTYLPLLLVAGDRRVMGRYANGPVARTVGWFYMALVTVAALAANGHTGGGIPAVRALTPAPRRAARLRAPRSLADR